MVTALAYIQAMSDDILRVEQGSLYRRCTAWKRVAGSKLNG